MKMCLEVQNKEKNLDHIFKAFADERRRLVIQHLRDASYGVASYDDLVGYVSSHCEDSHDSEKVKSQLHHVILPKLEKVDILEYDRRSEMIRYQSESVVDDLAEFIEDIED